MELVKFKPLVLKRKSQKPEAKIGLAPPRPEEGYSDLYKKSRGDRKKKQVKIKKKSTPKSFAYYKWVDSKTELVEIKDRRLIRQKRALIRAAQTKEKIIQQSINEFAI